MITLDCIAAVVTIMLSHTPGDTAMKPITWMRIFTCIGIIHLFHLLFLN